MARWPATRAGSGGHSDSSSRACTASTGAITASCTASTTDDEGSRYWRSATDVLFRRTLDLGPGRVRATAAALALATIPLGVWLSALLQLTALVLVLAGSLAAEPAVLRPRGRQPRR